jgi:RNA polymerase sigma-70 factor (ECF subfamily)
MSAAHSCDHQQLYRQLVDGDPTAPSDLAVAFLDPLIDWLTEHNRAIPLDLINQAAEDAILALIRNPASYRPQKGSLEAYLRMSAQADLRNLLQRETRYRNRHERLEVVELSQERGKYLGRTDDPSLALRIEEEQMSMTGERAGRVLTGLTEEEARVWELMEDGERRHACYAEACGITDRPLEEQRRHVKQVKDRLKKRSQRQGGS